MNENAQKMTPRTCLGCGKTFWSFLLISPSFTNHAENCNPWDES